MALYGATIGKVGVLGIEAATNQACANCVVNEKVIDRWFLFYFLTQQRDQLIEAGQGGAQPNLTNQIVRSWPLRLPPIPEQRKIVRRVVELFKLADAIEKRVAVATARAEKLTQAILAKAFRGELVPTEAELARREGRTYEPASALLERIRTESAGADPKADRRQRRAVPESAPRRARAQVRRGA